MQLIYVHTVYTCVVQDLHLLQHVWEITREWNANWNNLKACQLATLQTDSMDSTAQTMLKELHKLQRELKVSSTTQSSLKSCCGFVDTIVIYCTCELLL